MNQFRTFATIQYSLFCLLIVLITPFSNLAQNTIMNGGFELGTDYIPNDWSLDIGSARTSDYASSGSYSMSVWNWYWYAEGMAVNGHVDQSNIYNFLKYAGTPFVHVPESVEGMYLYDTTATYSDNDSAVVEVFLKRYNTATGSLDTVAYGLKQLPATSMNQGFVPFEVPIESMMPGVSPDSIVIVLKSALSGFCSDLNESGNCLYFYVDDLSANLTAGINIPLNGKSISYGPNPVIDDLSLSLLAHKKAHVRLLNPQGKLVLSNKVDSFSKLKMRHLSTGVYTLIIEADGSSYAYQILKK